MNLKASIHPEFPENIMQKGVVLASFSADWSTPCNAQKAITEKLRKQYDRRIYFKTIDVDEDKDLAELFRITSIPTLILFKNGTEVNRFVGLQKTKTLSCAIENALI